MIGNNKNLKQIGRKKKTDPAIHRYSIKLNSEENAKFISLFLQSGSTEKSKFITSMIFGRPMKVIKIDKISQDYFQRLTNFYAQYQYVGNNYNQTVKAIKTNFSERRATVLLNKLEKATVELVTISKEIIKLTKEFEDKWLLK